MGFGGNSGVCCAWMSGLEGSGEGPGHTGGLFSVSSSSASGLQVEYLYSLVYQALDFISGKR